MDGTKFNALRVSEEADGTYTRSLAEQSVSDLPPGELLIRVHYSSLNYKDALSATGNKGVTRSYPHTPGIDAAGVVEISESPAFLPGDEVISIGNDLGMNTPGGFGDYIRIPASWAVKRPPGLSLRESMILGTAGFTAAMSVEKLVEHGIRPGDGELLVTGATGGVGCVAVALLASLDYQVAAATGKVEKHGFLRELGASSVMGRDEVIDENNRPLLPSRWVGVVDAVGGGMLSSAIRATGQWGAVTCCGNVASPRLETTVYPFILRGITLYGINSEKFPIQERARLWNRLATEWKLDNLDTLAREIRLEELSREIDVILAGGQSGRVLVKLE
jgi:acrylyl-CoA reductase (NADPH)